MTNSNEQSITDLIDGLAHGIDNDFVLSPGMQDIIAQYSGTLNPDEDFSNFLNSSSNLSDMLTTTPSGYSPDTNSNHHESSTLVSQAVILPSNMQMIPTCLEMIAQPYYGKKLRYRSDYEKNENRLGVLKNRNKTSSYQGPAIRIPQPYLIANGQYFIRVTLVTAKYQETNLHYFHPYELEHPTNEELNDREFNSVWFEIQNEDCISGIKSFPSLRIVKKKAQELKIYGKLRVFDCEMNSSTESNPLPQLNNTKDTITKYNLDKSQLAFTIGRILIKDGQLTKEPYRDTTVYSEEMIEGAEKESDSDNDIQSPVDKSIASPASCRVYKYAPRYGFETSQEDMVVFVTSKLEPKKYGELKVVFECNTSRGRWSEAASDLDVKDRMISFKTPTFPYPFDITMAVDVKLQQHNRDIGTIKYHYLSTIASCSKCQQNAIQSPTDGSSDEPRKRSKKMISTTNWQHDAPEPVSNDTANSQNLLTAQLSRLSVSSTASSSNRVSSPPTRPSQTPVNPHEDLMTRLASSIESLFTKNDQTPFLRICRPFLKKSPELIHKAIENNHSDILLNFLPMANIDILQQRNQYGETIFLHILRLNQLEYVKILLESKHSMIILKDTDSKQNNLFHIMALDSTISSELIELLINYCLKKDLNIHREFDNKNEDSLTPLQLSVIKNNFLTTKYFLKYFNKNVYETKKSTGDNLIHLAVRHGDLTMIKYLIEDGQLFEQGKQLNLTMTPSDLARSLKRDDLIEYFKKIYPSEEVDEDESSDEDDDE